MRFASVLQIHDLETHLTNNPPMLSSPPTKDETEKQQNWDEVENKFYKSRCRMENYLMCQG